MSNFIFFHNVFYAICTLQSLYSHISVVVCSFFEFGIVSKWYIREWVNEKQHFRALSNDKIFYSSILVANAAKKWIATKMLKLEIGREENNVGKGENAEN